MIRFAAVHALYVEQEDTAKAELGRAERARQECLVFRDRLVADLAAAGQGLTHYQHEQYQAHWQAQQLRLQHAGATIAAADQAVEKARTLLAEAHQRQATIAKLRERDRQAELIREARREQRRSDDRTAMKRN